MVYHGMNFTECKIVITVVTQVACTLAQQTQYPLLLQFFTCISGGTVASVLLDVVQPTRAAVLARSRVTRVRYGYLAEGRGESQRTLARETGLRMWRQLGDGAGTSILAPGHGARMARILPLTVRSDEQSGTTGNRK